MDGILLVNKEKGLSSQAVLTKLKHILNETKIGHCGTLDPLASGVLVVLLGSATKLSNFLLEKDKEYIAQITIGKATSTYDGEGEVVESKKCVDLSSSQIDEALKSFKGCQLQTPPIYSAIKVDGKKLYQYALENKDVEIKKRDIEIFSIDRTSDIKIEDDTTIFSIKTCVSKGTYIRSLAFDIGKKLGYPSFMSDLTRTKSGKFAIEDSYSIEDIEKGNYKLISMVDSIDIKKIEVKDEIYKKAINGAKISFKDINSDDLIALIFDNNLVAIYEKTKECYKVVRVWN